MKENLSDNDIMLVEKLFKKVRENFFCDALEVMEPRRDKRRICQKNK